MTLFKNYLERLIEANTAADAESGQSGASDPGLTAFRPTGALAETFPRNAGVNYPAVTQVSGRLDLTGIYLPAAITVSALTFFTIGAVGTPTNQWAALFDSTLALQAISADDTTTAWAANTYKTFSMTAPYITPDAGIYYIGLCVVASAMPRLIGWHVANGAAFFLEGPIIGGKSSTGLTTPATCPDPAPLATGPDVLFYSYVS